jgi:hypothetical protein
MMQQIASRLQGLGGGLTSETREASKTWTVYQVYALPRDSHSEITFARLQF